MSEREINPQGFIQLLTDTFYLDEQRTYELGHRNATITEANERLRRIREDPEQLIILAKSIEDLLRQQLTAKQRQAVYLRYRLYDPPLEDELPLHDYRYVGKNMGGRTVHASTAKGSIELGLKKLRRYAEEQESGINGFKFIRRRIQV